MREIKYKAYIKDLNIIVDVTCIDFEIERIWYKSETTGRSNADFLECVLLQYTGLNDRNRREIYEGYIVKCEKRGYAFYKSIVKYNDVMGRFDIVQGDGSFPLTLEEIVDDISIGGLDYWVIGNIYENPELLEGRE